MRMKSALIAFAVSVCIVASVAAEDIGNVTIPKVSVKGTTVNAGTYYVKIAEKAGNVMFQLWTGKSGELVVEELAITKPSGKQYSSARIAYQSLKQDPNDPLKGRILVAKGDLYYFLYCEK